MQIVGLYKEDGYKYIHENNFTGITVFKTNNMEVNFATHPVQGFQELNVNLIDKNGLNLWADWIQYAIRYTLEEMYGGKRSEERRVGKECRSRWAPDDERKVKRK